MSSTLPDQLAFQLSNGLFSVAFFHQARLGPSGDDAMAEPNTAGSGLRGLLGSTTLISSQSRPTVVVVAQDDGAIALLHDGKTLESFR